MEAAAIGLFRSEHARRAFAGIEKMCLLRTCFSRGTAPPRVFDQSVPTTHGQRPHCGARQPGECHAGSDHKVPRRSRLRRHKRRTTAAVTASPSIRSELGGGTDRPGRGLRSLSQPADRHHHDVGFAMVGFRRHRRAGVRAMSASFDRCDVPQVSSASLAQPMQAMIAAGRWLVLLRGISDRELRDVEHAVWDEARGQLVTEGKQRCCASAPWSAYLRAPGCNTCSCAVAWRLSARPCRWRPRCGSTCNRASTRQNSCARWAQPGRRRPAPCRAAPGSGLLRLRVTACLGVTPGRERTPRGVRYATDPHFSSR